jgi:hypothetical protein
MGEVNIQASISFALHLVGKFHVVKKQTTYISMDTLQSNVAIEHPEIQLSMEQ